MGGVVVALDFVFGGDQSAVLTGVGINNSEVRGSSVVTPWFQSA